MIHEWPTGTPHLRPASRPRLSAGQKWDLARIAAAGLVTMMALGGSAWVITSEGEPGTGSTAAAAEPHRLTPDQPAAVTIETAEILAPVIVEHRPEPPRPARPAIRRPAPAPATKSAAAVTTDQSRSLTGRLARLITGDGRHDVRPFPTVPDGH